VTISKKIVISLVIVLSFIGSGCQSSLNQYYLSRERKLNDVVYHCRECGLEYAKLNKFCQIAAKQGVYGLSQIPDPALLSCQD